MKTLADHIVGMPTPFGERHATARAHQSMLRKPATNHSLERPAAFVDRFCFPRQIWTDLLSARDVVAANYRQSYGQAIKPPVTPCWLEVHTPHERIGFMLIADDQIASTVTIVGYSDGGGNDWGTVFRGAIDSIGRWHIQRQSTDDLAQELGVLVVTMCGVLGGHRTVLTRSREHQEDTAAGRALARRRAQQGRPLFSYNVVSLPRPEPSTLNGSLKASISASGVRGHVVIGHWRLIDGALEPYWVWVDGHERGCPDLGWVTKERHVHLAPEVRRGFVRPSFSGQPGQRLPASRVH